MLRYTKALPGLSVKPSSRASEHTLVPGEAEMQGGNIRTTHDVTTTDDFMSRWNIRSLFRIFSHSNAVTRLIVESPDRLDVLSDMNVTECIHVGIHLRPGTDEQDRIEALRRAPVAVKFIQCNDVEHDLVSVDLTGIDYVTDGTIRYDVEDV